VGGSAGAIVSCPLTIADPVCLATDRSRLPPSWVAAASEEREAPPIARQEGSSVKHIFSLIVGPLCVVVALAFMGPAGARASARHARSGQSVDKDSASGRQLFLQNCARCHGNDAKGKNGPRLVGKSLSLDEIEKTVTDGRPPKMPSFGKQLSSTEVKAVSAYVRSLGKGS
jgi:mono/diheme cytochrome c family protein